LRTLRLRRPLRRAIERGHPWIYDQAAGVVDGEPGDVVKVADERGAFAVAFVDPEGPIRGRVLVRNADAEVGDAWAREAARVAAGHRKIAPELATTNALRVIHGENDGLPGLTVDVYAGVAVIVFDGGAAAAFWRPRVDAVIEGVRDGGVEVNARWIRATRGGKGAGSGDDVPSRVMIREGAATFGVDVKHGQKTGFFLDQRANRGRVAQLARDARVLNLCSYSGGFSVLAGLGGAAHVTSVDLAAPAITDAERHWRDNGLAPERHTGVVADAFDFLELARSKRDRWDIVVSDPPSFAPSESARPRALAAYERLARLTLGATARGGVLVFASCSSHITESDLRAILASADSAQSARNLRIVEARGAAADHPTIPGFPEGRYLKLLIAAA
jgi:23S rRNA (cytosine1962-C5)-methyltransferase